LHLRSKDLDVPSDKQITAFPFKIRAVCEEALQACQGADCS
jgi:hypothetical protein